MRSARKRKSHRRFMLLMMTAAVILFAAGFSALRVGHHWPIGTEFGFGGGVKPLHGAGTAFGGKLSGAVAAVVRKSGAVGGGGGQGSGTAAASGGGDQHGSTATPEGGQAPGKTPADGGGSATGGKQDPAGGGAGEVPGGTAAGGQSGSPAAAGDAGQDGGGTSGVTGSQTGSGGASDGGQPLSGDGSPAQPAVVKLDKPTWPAAVFKPKSGSKLVALTFDDGPDNRYTPAILDILDKYEVKATFFTVGIQVKKFPGIAQRIVKEGHEIGNHTYHHADLTKIDDGRIQNELQWTDTLIERTTGYVPDLVRAPYGAVSQHVKDIVQENDRTLVGWTVDTRDWAGESVAEMRANVDKNTHPGGIVLMHSFGGKSIKNTVSLLPYVIEDLQKKGYTFVTVGQLLAAKAQAAHH